MKEELEWVRSNAKGRQTKSKARLARFEELSDVEYQRATRPTRSSSRWPSAGQRGDRVQNVSKSFGDRLLIDNLSFQVPAAPSSASSARTAPA